MNSDQNGAVGQHLRATTATVVGWIAMATFGLVGVLAGGFNGAGYLNYREDFGSMLMASGLALALGAYLAGIYRAV